MTCQEGGSQVKGSELGSGTGLLFHIRRRERGVLSLTVSRSQHSTITFTSLTNLSALPSAPPRSGKPDYGSILSY